MFKYINKLERKGEEEVEKVFKEIMDENVYNLL